MAVYEIPLTPNPQRFRISLGGVVYQMLLTYKNVVGGGWVIDIADSAGNPMVAGIPLVTGVDLLSPHRHLGFTGGLTVLPKADKLPPTFENLGVETFLLWTTTP